MNKSKTFNIELLSSKISVEGSKLFVNKFKIKNISKNFIPICFIGSQSSGKTTLMVSMFGLKTDKHLISCGKSTNLVDLVYLKDKKTILMDVEGFWSPQNWLKFRNILLNKKNGGQSKLKNDIEIKATDLNNNLSYKLSKFMYFICKIIFFCLKSSELNGTQIFEMIEEIQESTPNCDIINKPYIIFVCRSDNNMNEIELKNKLLSLEEEFSVLKKFSGFSFYLVPSFKKGVISKEHKEKTKIIWDSINNKNLVLSTNYILWKRSLPLILSCVNKDKKIMTIEEIKNTTCVQLFESAKKYLVKYFDEIKRDNKYKLINIEKIANSIDSVFDNNNYPRCTKYKICKGELHKLIKKEYNAYILYYELQLFKKKEEILKKVIMKYEENLVANTPITEYEKRRRLRLCADLIDLMTRETDIIVKKKSEWHDIILGNNKKKYQKYIIKKSEWYDIILGIHKKKYEKCSYKCESRDHYCIVGGLHKDHKFINCKKIIICNKGCGLSKEISCKEYKGKNMWNCNKVNFFNCEKCGQLKKAPCNVLNKKRCDMLKIKCSRHKTCLRTGFVNCTTKIWKCSIDNARIYNCIFCKKSIKSCIKGKKFYTCRSCYLKNGRRILGCSCCRHLNFTDY